MLGDPVARVSELVGQAGEVKRVVQGIGAAGSLGDRRLVEDAQPRRRAHVPTDSGMPASAGARWGGRRIGISTALASAHQPSRAAYLPPARPPPARWPAAETRPPSRSG